MEINFSLQRPATLPEMADVLNPISAALDTETITGLNAQVDIEGEEYEDVAAEFYESIK